MRIPRVFVEQALRAGKTIELPDWAAEHLVRVLRVPVGGALICFNGDGFDYPARIAKAEKRYVSAELLDRVEVNTAPRLRITLAQAMARGEKMDWILQKASELGVTRIAPVITDRTEVKLDADREEKRVQHWQRVIQSACEQCGRAELPQLDAPRSLIDFAADSTWNDAVKLTLAPGGVTRLAELPKAEHYVVVIGPEGGLSEREIELLKPAGFLPTAIGPRILRTETAGAAILSALQARFGDF